MRPNLQIDTAENRRTSDDLASHTTLPTMDVSFSFDVEKNYMESYEEGSPRTIRRTFAFDEWEEEETIPKERNNTATENMDDEATAFQEKLDRIIHRTLAFDEWDDIETGNLDDCKGFETPFTQINNYAETPPKKLCAEINQTTTTNNTITPTPSSKRNPRIERPFVVYSHQSIDFPDYYSAIFSHEKQDQNVTHTHTYFEDPELGIVKHQYKPHSSSFPRCESIPRRASAFHRVSPSMDACIPQGENSDLYCIPNHPDCHLQDPNMFGHHDLFQDDDVFESPSSHSEDFDSTSHTIPEYIVFYKTE